MLISLLEHINNFNEQIFSPIDKLIELLPFEDWILDALLDSIHLLPFLFVIFVLIEIMEFYFSDKIDARIKKARRSEVAVGGLASILPQCGFSVIASSLYSRKMITKGCLIAVYLGTSDETIPILLANPQKAYLILPIVGLKLLIAITMGYFIDMISGRFTNEKESLAPIPEDKKIEIREEGCCNHTLDSDNKRELILHPISHTVNIFGFILVITLMLNYALEHFSITEFLTTGSHKYLQCVIASFIGLIPNCAISIAITMMLIKGTLTFSAAMSGLLSNAGLGLLVLLKNNDFKDTLKIILILLFISIFSGFAIEFVS